MGGGAAPFFPRATIRRGNGVTITIEAPAAAPDAAYVRAVRVDGKDTTRSWLPEAFVSTGGTVSMDVAARAEGAWGTKPEDVPPSFSP